MTSYTVYPCLLQFNVVFSFSHEDFQQDELIADSSVCKYSSKLCVEFSTGAKQVS